MNHASVFSGIGGPEVAAAMLGWTELPFLSPSGEQNPSKHTETQ